MKTMNSIFEFLTPQFGWLRVAAHDKSHAEALAGGFRGWSRLSLMREYRFCERCESKPCVCPQGEGDR